MLKNKTKCLITGGAGFIGSHLASRLSEIGHDVTVLDNLMIQNAWSNIPKTSRMTFIKGSVTDQKLMFDLVPKYEVVFHLAAMLGVKTTMTHTAEMIQNNLQGTTNVLEAAKISNTKVIFASTSEVYGKGEPPFSEDMDLHFGTTSKLRWSYAMGKSLEECLCIYHGLKGLPITIIRYFNVYGSRQKEGSYGGVIPRFIKAALKDEDVPVYGDGSQTRSFTHVSDAVEATIRCMRKEVNQEILNIGSDDEITIKDLAFMIKELTHSSSNIIYVPHEVIYPHGFEEINRRIADMEKAKTLLEYHPKMTLEEGLKESIKWYQSYFRKGDFA